MSNLLNYSFWIFLVSGIMLFSNALAQGDLPAEEDIEQQMEDVETKWGPDSVQAVRCHSLYRSDFRNDRIAEAYSNWRCNYELAPQSSIRIYIDGVHILRHQIENAETDEEKAAYVDTLMQLFDDRIKHFGDEGFVLGRKGVELIRHDRSQLREAYEILDKSIELQGYDTEFSVPYTYIIALTRLFDAEVVSEEDFMGKYANVMDIIQHNLNQNCEFHDQWTQVRNMVQDVSRQYVSCDMLDNIYKKQLEQSPDDEDIIRNGMAFFNANNCTESKVYHKLAVKHFSIEPTADIATYLANHHQEKEEFSKALELFEKAIELDDDKVNIGRHYLSMANIYLSLNRFPMAKQKAEKAMEYRPNWGLPYIFIGNLYVQGAENCTEGIEERIVYLIAVDYYKRAKEVDPTTESRANQLIKTYSQYFPETEDLFFHGLRVGEEYSIGCWINETTTIRVKK